MQGSYFGLYFVLLHIYAFYTNNKLITLSLKFFWHVCYASVKYFLTGTCCLVNFSHHSILNTTVFLVSICYGPGPMAQCLDFVLLFISLFSFWFMVYDYWCFGFCSVFLSLCIPLPLMSLWSLYSVFPPFIVSAVSEFSLWISCFFASSVLLGLISPGCVPTCSSFPHVYL